MSRTRSSARRPSTSKGLLIAATALLAGLPSPSFAEGVNHSELEEMFGEPVTTSVTGKPQRASETPAALTIITRDDIRRSPARDIIGLLRTHAGVDVARWTAGHTEASLRGGVQPYNSRLLVLVNGQQVYLDHQGMTNWAGIAVQLEEVQQIEVVRGPNSALFGFNAVSGVINIITINPLQTEQLVMTASGGSNGYLRTSASAAARLNEHLGVRLSAGQDRSNELPGVADGSVVTFTGTEIVNTRHTTISGELYGKLSEQTEAVLSASHSNSRQVEFLNVLSTAQSLSEFTSFGGRISHDAGWGVISAKAYTNEADIFSPNVRLPNPLQIHNKVVVASANALVRAGASNTLRAGIEYRRNEMGASPGFPGLTRYDLYAFSGMWEGMLSERFTVTLAGRADRLDLSQTGEVTQPTTYTKADFDRSLTSLSFNGALLFKLDERSAVRASVARGVQAPSLFSLGSRLTIAVPGVTIPFLVAGDPSLEPSPMWSAEIGYSRSLDDHGGRFELNAFYNRTADIIGTPGNRTTPVATPPAYPFIQSAAANVGRFNAFGLEASLRGRWGESVEWLIDYTWVHARQRIAGETATHFEWPIALDRTTPEHKIRTQVSYARGPWLGSVGARYTSAIQQLAVNGSDTRLVPVSNTLAIDAKVAVAIGTALTLEVAGENLTDAAGVDLSPIPAQRRLRAGATLRF